VKWVGKKGLRQKRRESNKTKLGAMWGRGAISSENATESKAGRKKKKRKGTGERTTKGQPGGSKEGKGVPLKGGREDNSLTKVGLKPTGTKANKFKDRRKFYVIEASSQKSPGGEKTQRGGGRIHHHSFTKGERGQLRTLMQVGSRGGGVGRGNAGYAKSVDQRRGPKDQSITGDDGTENSSHLFL